MEWGQPDTLWIAGNLLFFKKKKIFIFIWLCLVFEVALRSP